MPTRPLLPLVLLSVLVAPATAAQPPSLASGDAGEPLRNLCLPPRGLQWGLPGQPLPPPPYRASESLTQAWSHTMFAYR